MTIVEPTTPALPAAQLMAGENKTEQGPPWWSVTKTTLPVRWTQVRSLVGEIDPMCHNKNQRSHTPQLKPSTDKQINI